MLNKLKKNRSQQGFTIIEVMIVLAIAALILLIVLLAVPALQRSSRNTTIKNDVSAIAGGINTFESDNNGSTPTAICGTGTVVISTGTCGTPTGTPEKTTVNGATVVALGTPASGNIGGVVTTGVLATSTVDVSTGKTCPANGAAVSTATASVRSIALYYVTETSGGNTLQCEQS